MNTKRLLQNRGKKVLVLLLITAMLAGFVATTPTEPVMAYGEGETFYVQMITFSGASSFSTTGLLDGLPADTSLSVAVGTTCRGYLVAADSVSASGDRTIIKEITALGEIEDGDYLCILPETYVKQDCDNGYELTLTLNAPDSPTCLNDFTYSVDGDLSASEYKELYGRDKFRYNISGSSTQYDDIAFSQTGAGYHFHTEVSCLAYNLAIAYAEGTSTCTFVHPDVQKHGMVGIEMDLTHAEEYFYENTDGNIFYENDSKAVIHSFEEFPAKDNLDIWAMPKTVTLNLFYLLETDASTDTTIQTTGASSVTYSLMKDPVEYTTASEAQWQASITVPASWNEPITFAKGGGSLNNPITFSPGTTYTLSNRKAEGDTTTYTAADCVRNYTDIIPIAVGATDQFYNIAYYSGNTPIDTTTDLGYVNVYLIDENKNITAHYGKCGIVNVDIENNVRQTVNACKIDLSSGIDASKCIYGYASGRVIDGVSSSMRLYSDGEAYYLYDANKPTSVKANIGDCAIAFYESNEDEPRTIEWRYSVDVGNILSDTKSYQVGLLENATVYSDWMNTRYSSSFEYHYENGNIIKAEEDTDSGYGQFFHYATEYFSIQPPKVSEGHAWRYDGNLVFTEVSAEPSAKPETKFVERIAVGDVLTGYTDYLVSYANDGENDIPFIMTNDSMGYNSYESTKNINKNGGAVLVVSGVDGTEETYPLFVPSSNFNLTETADGNRGDFLIHLPNKHNYEITAISEKHMDFSKPAILIRPSITLEEQHVFLEENKEVAETDSFGNITKYVYHCVENDADEYVWLKAKELEYQPIRIAGQDYDEARITSMVEAACENESLLDGEIITKVVDVILETSTDNARWTTVANSDVPSKGWTIKLDYPEGTNKCSYAFVVSHLLTTDEGDKKAGQLEFPEIVLEEDGIVLTVHSFSPFTVSYAVKPGVVLSGIAAEYLGGAKNIGDEVTKSELKVTAIYSDGSTRILKDEEYIFNPGTILQEGTNVITITAVENELITTNVVIGERKKDSSAKKDEFPNTSSTQPAANLSATIPDDKGNIPGKTGVTAPRTSDSKVIYVWIGAVIGGIVMVLASVILWIRKRHTK